MIEGWFDIHNHILPGVDDGAEDLETAKQMLTMAYKEGVRKMIVTPHYHVHHYTETGVALIEPFQKLREYAQVLDENFEIYLGNEIYHFHDADKRLNDGTIRTMAGSKYVLVEFRPSKDYSYIKNALYGLIIEGYLPIIAHIERYQCLVNDIDLVDELYNMGVYIQVNAASITGENGRISKKFTRNLLKMEMIHFVGTDAHNLRSRSPKMKKCASIIMRKCDPDYAEDVLYHNPMKIVENEEI